MECKHDCHDCPCPVSQQPCIDCVDNHDVSDSERQRIRNQVSSFKK